MKLVPAVTCTKMKIPAMADGITVTAGIEAVSGRIFLRW
jgi:hypothetical protein